MDPFEAPKPCLSPPEQVQLLGRMIEALAYVRRSEPKLTLTGLHALLYLARKGLARDVADLPSVGEIGTAVMLSPSGASRLMATLCSEEQTRYGASTKSQALIETKSWIRGKRYDAYVLSLRGRELIKTFISLATGQDASAFDPHSVDSLFALLFVDDKSK